MQKLLLDLLLLLVMRLLRLPANDGDDDARSDARAADVTFYFFVKVRASKSRATRRGQIYVVYIRVQVS